jgi:hypothetical protein
MIWQDEKSQNGGFDATNTLLIDSDAFKVRDYPENSVVIKPYTKEEVLANSGDNINILTQVRDYVLRLLDEAVDVMDYIKNNQFEFSDAKEQMKVADEKKEKKDLEYKKKKEE